MGGHESPKGSFDLAGRLPRVRENVVLIKGWFDKTLPEFLLKYPDKFSFIHIDCDTYEAARTVLALCKQRITSGTIIVFDEYFGYRGWKQGEFKAWQEFCQETGFKYKYIAFSNEQVALVIHTSE